MEDLDLHTIAYRLKSGTHILVSNLQRPIAQEIAERVRKEAHGPRVACVKQVGMIGHEQHELLLRFPMAPYEIKAWDDAVLSLGLPLEGWGCMVTARQRLGIPRPNGPSRKASDRCESGKHDYCTCDTCF